MGEGSAQLEEEAVRKPTIRDRAGCPRRLRHARIWIRAQYSQRRWRVITATPRWADREAIAALYEEARRLTETTGIRHEVDHIYPIFSDTICGLHVHTNLRIVTAAVNGAKSNRWEEIL